MPWVKLRRDWPGTFRRYVRDAAGNIIDTLTFKPDEPFEVKNDPQYLDSIRGSLGHALLPLEFDETRRKFNVISEAVDVDATAVSATAPAAAQEVAQDPLAIPEVSEVEATAQDAPDVTIPDVPDLSEVLAGREAPKPRKPGRS